MKWIAMILACVVLFLSVQPVCGAAIHSVQADACCQEGCADDGSPAGAHEEDGCAVCNPFQACACCVIGVVPPPAALQLPGIPKQATTVTWSPLVLHLPETDAAGFWQPPRD